MSVKINSQVAQKKNLFSKLQSLTFTNFVPTFSESRIGDDRGGHLDVESQEILLRLKGNIEKLSDASSRVEFMMGELSQIMKKGL
jgi:hypothetical protein